MKSKKVNLLVSICLVLVLITSVLLAACAKEEAPAAPAPAAPAKPAPATPTPATTTPATTTPTAPTPAAPAPTAPAPAPAPAPKAEVYKWKMGSHQAPTNVTWLKTETNFIERIVTGSDGRIQIEHFSAGQIVPSTELLMAVAKGVLDMTRMASSYNSGLMPEVYAALFPMGPRNSEDMAMIWERGMGDLYKASYAKHGVKLLTMMITSDIPLYSTVKVERVKNFKGMKIRTHGATALLLEQLGASTTYITGGEVYLALSTGVVDAATWGGYSVTVEKRWYEVAKYIIHPPLIGMFAQEDLMINMDLWNGLPSDLQSIIQTAADWSMFQQRIDIAMMDGPALQTMQDAGVEIITLPAADVAQITEAAKIVWDDIASRSPEAYQAVKIITEYINEKGYTDYVLGDRNIEVKQ